MKKLMMEIIKDYLNRLFYKINKINLNTCRRVIFKGETSLNYEHLSNHNPLQINFNKSIITRE